MTAMLEFSPNQAMIVEQIRHPDPEISVHVVNDFLEDPGLLLDYAENKAYFGKPGDDRTAYPGIRDRLPRAYENALEKVVALVYGARDIVVHRCMLSLPTTRPEDLAPAQRIPHVDAFADDQYASVHYLCGPPHGGTAIYRYLPRNLARIRNRDRSAFGEMIKNVHDFPDEHVGYLDGDTRFYRRELLIAAKFNRIVLYPSNLLHAAQISRPESLHSDFRRGRLSVASFFRLGPETSPPDIA